MRALFKSLTVRIGAIIVLTEIVFLTIVGIFYTSRFQEEIDQEVQSRIQLPGQLINIGLLNLNAVEDNEIMEQLVGKDLVELRDGLVFAENDSIYYSYNPEHVGITMSDMHGETTDWSSVEPGPSLTRTMGTDGERFITHFFRLSVSDRTDRAFYFFMTVSVDKAEVKKAAVRRIFFIGAMAAVLLTSLVIVFLMHSSIVSRVKRVLTTVRRVEEGDFAARVETPIGSDEIGAVQIGVNAMAAELEQTVGALRKNEARYRAIIEEQTEMIVRGLPDGTRTFVNQNYCRCFGLDLSHAIGGSFYDFIPENDREAVRQDYASFTPENPLATKVLQVVKSDEVIGWHEWKIRAFFDEDGQFIEFQAVGRDITASVRAEEKLRESEQRFRLLSEAAFEGITITDTGTVIDLNERLAESLGYDIDEIVGKSVTDFVAPGSQRLVVQRIESGEEAPYEHLALRKDGSTFPVEVQGRTIPYKGRALRMTAIRDISERKEAEETSRAFTERLQILRDIDRAILATQAVNEIADSVLEYLAQVVPYYRSSVYIYDKSQDLFEVIATCSVRDTWLKPGARESSKWFRNAGFTDSLVDGQITNVPDISKYENDSELFQLLRDEGVRSAVGIPLLAKGDLIGILSFTSQEPNAFTELHIDIAQQIADSLAIALQQTQYIGEITSSREKHVHLSHRLVALQEEERRRLAQDLHDEVGGLLSALQLVINRPELDKDGDQKRSKMASELVDALTEEIRTISLRLRPRVLDDLGLIPALNWLFKRYGIQTSISVKFDHDIDEDTRFSSELETTAFRITQEALTNVAKHANVEVVEVRISAEPDQLVLHILDEGKGFDPDDAALRKESLGLSGMTERAALLSGTLSFQSSPGKGTHITATLPIAFKQ